MRNKEKGIEKPYYAHDNALQSLKKLKTKDLRSLLRKIAPFVIKGIKIYGIEKKVQKDLPILLKNLEGDFSSSFFKYRKILLKDIKNLKKSEFTWSDGSKSKIFRLWDADINRKVEQKGRKEHNDWEKETEKKIKEKEANLIKLNIENEFILADYRYGKKFKQYMPTVIKFIKKIIAEI